MEPVIPRDPASYTLSHTSLHQSPIFTDEARVTCLDVVWLYPNFLVPQCHLEQASLPQSGPPKNSKNVPQLLPQLRPHPGERQGSLVQEVAKGHIFHDSRQRAVHAGRGQGEAIALITWGLTHLSGAEVGTSNGIVLEPLAVLERGQSVLSSVMLLPRDIRYS